MQETSSLVPTKNLLSEKQAGSYFHPKSLALFPPGRKNVFHDLTTIFHYLIEKLNRTKAFD